MYLRVNGYERSRGPETVNRECSTRRPKPRFWSRMRFSGRTGTCSVRTERIRRREGYDEQPSLLVLVSENALAATTVTAVATVSAA